MGCLGCFNPETHDFKNDALYNVEEVFSWVAAASDIEGLTVSGGEPLQQPESLLELLELVYTQTDLSVLLFTGFSFEEVELMPCFNKLQSLVDVMIAGRYKQEVALRSGLIGSSNKTMHFFSDRYSKEDLVIVPVSEVIISPNGEMAVTGIDPVSLR